MPFPSWYELPCGCKVRYDLNTSSRKMMVCSACSYSTRERPIHKLCNRLWFKDNKTLNEIIAITNKVTDKLDE